MSVGLNNKLMYQELVSYETNTGVSNSDTVAIISIFISETESGITLTIEKEVKEVRPQGNFKPKSKSKLCLNKMSAEDIIKIKKLVDSWLGSESHPTLSTTIEEVTGTYNEDRKIGQIRGTSRKQPLFEFRTLDIYIGTAGVVFQFSAGAERKSLNLPASKQINEGNPEDYDNLAILSDTIYDYISLEYKGDVEKLNISLPPTIDQEEMLDTELARRAVSEFKSGHFQSSVRTAFTVLEERVREVGDYPDTAYGTSLIQDAFHPKTGELSFGQSQGERDGVMFLYRGVFQALRNPASHRFIEEVDEEYARDAIHTVNLLLRLLAENQVE